MIHSCVCPVCFAPLCSPEVLKPWASWSTNKDALHSLTGLTAADFELVYERSKDKLLTLQRSSIIKTPITHTHTSHNLLVFVLHWLRRKPTSEELAQLYPHGVHYWHDMLRWVKSVFDECFLHRSVPSLASAAPTSVYFANVKSSSTVRSLLCLRANSSAPTTTRRVRRRQRGSMRLRAAFLTALSAAHEAITVAHTMCESFVSPVRSISRHQQPSSWVTRATGASWA